MAAPSVATSEYLIYAVLLIVESLSSVIISRYDPSHNSNPIQCLSWPESEPWAPSWQDCARTKVLIYFKCIISIADLAGQSIFRIPAIYAFDNPSPAIFVVAVATFTSTTLLVHTMHGNDRFQNRFLAWGVVAAVVTSSVRQSMAFDKLWTRTIQSCLPLSVGIALLISDIYHRTHRRVQSNSSYLKSLEAPSEKSKEITEWQ